MNRIGAAYYTGNCHKWLCAPKGVGFLHVRRDRQQGIQPPIISHGWNQPRPGYSPFQDAFDWPGTLDPTPWLCVGESIRFLSGLMPGGLRSPDAAQPRTGRCSASESSASGSGCSRSASNRCSARWRRSICPTTRPRSIRKATRVPSEEYRLNNELFANHRIEVPAFFWPAAPRDALAGLCPGVQPFGAIRATGGSPEESRRRPRLRAGRETRDTVPSPFGRGLG